ncbi:MAG: hypothetical protein KDD39_05270 [Bdellovibrionales bacterium]|nr:hypothetical protein [Bdellovibrionales bacterium]
MAIQIGIHYQKELESPLSAPQTMDFFWDFERSLFPHFPGLKASENLGNDRYHWIFSPLSYGGYNIQIEFQTQFLREQNRIVVSSVPGVGFTTLDGAWSFYPAGGSTQVGFDFQIKGELALPFFLKGVVAPAAEKELFKLFSQYINNVEKAIQS